MTPRERGGRWPQQQIETAFICHPTTSFLNSNTVMSLIMGCWGLPALRTHILSSLWWIRTQKGLISHLTKHQAAPQRLLLAVSPSQCIWGARPDASPSARSLVPSWGQLGLQGSPRKRCSVWPGQSRCREAIPTPRTASSPPELISEHAPGNAQAFFLGTLRPRLGKDEAKFTMQVKAQPRREKEKLSFSLPQPASPDLPGHPTPGNTSPRLLTFWGLTEPLHFRALPDHSDKWQTPCPSLNSPELLSSHH